MHTKSDAIDLIDRAINYIDQHGFNISSYHTINGDACYIGTLRIVDRTLVEKYSNSMDRVMSVLSSTIDTTDTVKEGSPELKTALNVLDHLAAPLLKEGEWKTRGEEFSHLPGRQIESYGYQYRGQSPYYKEALETISGHMALAEDEQQEALKMLRKAKEVLVKELADDDTVVHVEGNVESDRADEDCLQLV